MARRCLPLLSILCVVLGACTSFQSVDLRPWLEQKEFPLSQGPVPQDAETVGLVVARDSGFYLFGMIPFVRMSLEDCIAELEREAKLVGGDGVAEITMKYQPASFLDITAILFPDWSAFVELSGSVWRRRR